jgi:hypothetical protein
MLRYRANVVLPAAFNSPCKNRRFDFESTTKATFGRFAQAIRALRAGVSRST